MEQLIKDGMTHQLRARNYRLLHIRDRLRRHLPDPIASIVMQCIWLAPYAVDEKLVNKVYERPYVTTFMDVKLTINTELYDSGHARCMGLNVGSSIWLKTPNHEQENIIVSITHLWGYLVHEHDESFPSVVDYVEVLLCDSAYLLDDRTTLAIESSYGTEPWAVAALNAICAQILAGLRLTVD